MSELEAYGAIVHAMAAAGGENPGITMPVLSGKKTWCPHAMASRKTIQPGELVMVDVSGVFKRYHCNMARTFAVGEPAKDVQEIARRAVGSMDLIRGMIKPNLRAGDRAKALIEYYAAQGIWEGGDGSVGTRWASPFRPTGSAISFSIRQTRTITTDSSSRAP